MSTEHLRPLSHRALLLTVGVGLLVVSVLAVALARSDDGTKDGAVASTTTGASTTAATAAASTTTAAQSTTVISTPTTGVAGPRVNLVNTYGQVWDVYFDHELRSAANGLEEGWIPAPVAAGPVTVSVHPHLAPPPVDDRLRTDQVQEQIVIVPTDVAASIVIGHSPAGGAGAPFVSVYHDPATTPPEGTGRLVVRHTADAAPLDYELVEMSGAMWTFAAQGQLNRGAEVEALIPVPEDRRGHLNPTQVLVTAWAAGGPTGAPPQLWAPTLVARGQTVIVYAVNRSSIAVNANPSTCPGVGTIPPIGAAAVSSASGDLDGDGGPDEVSVWAAAGANSAGSWWVGLSPGGDGGTAASPLPVPSDQTVAVVATGDADGDGSDEVVLRVGPAGRLEQLQLWTFTNCGFTPITVADEVTAATFPVGHDGQERHGVLCIYSETGWELSRWDITGTQLTRTPYRWDGLHLVADGGPERRPIDPSEEVALTWASRFSCGVPRLGMVTTTP